MSTENSTPVAREQARSEVPDASTNALSVPIHPFRESNPRMWFRQVESVFALRNIRCESTKFHHIISALPPHILDEVESVVDSPDPEHPYERLKDAIIQRLGLTESQRVSRLLAPVALGDRRPSQLLQEMQRLCAQTSVGESFLRELWLQKLPPEMIRILAARADADLPYIADLADRLAETYGPSRPVHSVSSDASTDLMAKMSECLTAMTQTLHALRVTTNQSSGSFRNRPRKRSKSRNSECETNSDLCYYHQRFGTQAKKCKPGCKHHKQNQGNSKAGT